MQVITKGTEGYNIEASGSVITYNLEPVTLELKGKADKDNLYVKFVFKTDLEDQKIRSESSIEKETTLVLALINYNVVLGAGTNQPQPVGTFEDRRLFIHFRVYGNDDPAADRLLYYTIYTSNVKSKSKTKKKAQK